MHHVDFLSESKMWQLTGSMLRCWSKHSPGHPGVLSNFQHRPSGSRCHTQFWSATLCLFLNPDLKLYCSLRLHWTVTEQWQWTEMVFKFIELHVGWNNSSHPSWSDLPPAPLKLRPYKGKVNHAPQESVGGCSCPSSRPWARRWRTTNVCDAWPVRRQTCGYLSKPQGTTAHWLVPNYTAWWQRHMCVNNLPRVTTIWHYINLNIIMPSPLG